MKDSLRKLVLGLALTVLVSVPAFGQSKLATVDLRKLFDNYWKKKQAEAALNERKADIEKEDRNMLEDYRKLKEDYQSMLTSASDQAVSSEERDKRKTAAEEKLRRLKELEESITQYERQARTNIGEQSQRMRANILKEITTVVTAKAKAAGYALVIDTAAESVNNTPIILFTNNENDITDSVLRDLNATAPTETTKADEKPGKK